jgi:hypothetical protein
LRIRARLVTDAAGCSHELPGLPRYQDLLWPTILALRDLGGSGSIEEIVEKVLELGDYSAEQQSVLHKDGPSTEIEYRLAWGRTYLKGMGLAVNSQRGVWSLTDEGRNVVESELEPLRQAYILRKREERKSGGSDGGDSEASEPDESAWQEHVLDALMQMSPAAFERLAQRLLREAGFIAQRSPAARETESMGLVSIGCRWSPSRCSSSASDMWAVSDLARSVTSGARWPVAATRAC